MSLPAPYVTSDQSSFAYSTIHERLPAILRQLIRDFETAASAASADAQKEAGDIKVKLENVLENLPSPQAVLKPFPNDSEPNFKAFNDGIAELNKNYGNGVTFQDGPWLFVECYFYRLLQSFFDHSTHWKRYDMFSEIKKDTFEKSSAAVSTLAARYISISEQLKKAEDPELRKEALKTVFLEVIQSSLWGNATDLSLLVNISLEDIKKLQVAAEHREKETVLADDFDKIWKQLSDVPGGRVDIVLDNAGFELYTDLVLILVLLDSGMAEQIVIHPKSQPWFVSDVTPNDWLKTLELLQDTKVFPEQRAAVDELVARISHYQNEGQIFLRPNAFWTGPCLFWELNENGKYGGKEIWSDLRASKLVFFKGDLNYRKLTGDLHWEHTTSFETALQPLATSGLKIAALRTVKGDVLVGIKPGAADKLNESWGKEKTPAHGWKWSGRYAVISYHG